MKFSSKLVLISGIVLSLSLSTAIAAAKSSENPNLKKFTKSFCIAAKGAKENIFKVSADLFGDQPSVFTCSDGNSYKIYKVEAKDDPGHFIFDVDAEKGSHGNIFDCDGKADVGMKVIGLNCFPVSKEVSEHRK